MPEVTITLHEELAQWLKYVMSKPINCPIPEHEDPVDYTNRKMITEILKSQEPKYECFGCGRAFFKSQTLRAKITDNYSMIGFKPDFADQCPHCKFVTFWGFKLLKQRRS